VDPRDDVHSEKDIVYKGGFNGEGPDGRGSLTDAKGRIISALFSKGVMIEESIVRNNPVPEWGRTAMDSLISMISPSGVGHGHGVEDEGKHCST